MSLELNLLGLFEARRDGELIRFPTERSRLLLAYLATSVGTPQPRQHLAALFWPERSEEAARNSLRTELNRLKQALGDVNVDTPILQSSRQYIECVPSAQLTIDLHQFQTLLAAARSHPHQDTGACPTCNAALQQATALYRNHFLVDMTLPESEELERWLSEKRTRFVSDVQWGFDTLVIHLLESDQPARAIALARRQLELQPWHEPAHRHLMRALTQNGQRTGALRQYEMLESVLETELAVRPSAETLALYRQISTDSLPGPSESLDNPYRGLQAFEPSAASLFFGRENMTERLYVAVDQNPFVALIGPSGSGKSSVVQAGLAPRLSATWQVAIFRPGAEPMRALEEALAPLFWRMTSTTAPTQAPSLPELAHAQAEPYSAGMGASQQTTLSSSTYPHTLLVVDQFEEIFTLCHDVATRTQFCDHLLDITLHPDRAPVTVLIVLRADFMAQALGIGRLADLLQDNSVILGPMNRDELRRAIERPALYQGVTFEPGLVERLLDDVGNEPGNLPLLQFALTLLWQDQVDGWLTHDAYDELERVVGAISHYASGIYARLDPTQQVQAQRIFLQLIQPGQGTVDTRRTATRTEIGEQDWQLVQYLADKRLVVTNRSTDDTETVEIVHEALLHEWPLLRTWLESNREFRLWQQRVRVSLEQWQHSADDSGPLLRGGQLIEAERWMQARGDELSSPLRTFIQASLAHRQQRELAQQVQQRKELEQAQAVALAETQRAESEIRSRQRLTFLTAGVAIAFFIAVLAAMVAFQSQRTIAVERNRAEGDARIALARQLSAQAIRNVEGHIDLALLLGMAATDIGLPVQDRNELLTELAVPPMLETVLHKSDAPVFDLNFSGDGQTLFVRDDKGSIWAWDLRDTSAQPTAIILQDDAIREVLFSMQGDRMAVNRVESVEVWDLHARQPILRVSDSQREIVSFGLSADGHYLLTSDGETLQIIEVASGTMVRSGLPYSSQPINTFDGVNFLYVVDGEGSRGELIQHVAHWNIDRNDVTFDENYGHTSNIHSWRFNQDGTTLATASFDGSVMLWDTKSALARSTPLRGHDGRVLIANFSPDGKMLVSGGVDGQLLVWDLQSEPVQAMRLHGHSNWVRGIAFSPDGQWMASGDIDGHILLWRVGDRQVLTGHTDRARTVNISHDGTRMVSAEFGKQIGVWDTSTNELIELLPTGFDNAVINAEFSPDDSTVVSVDAGGTVIFWDTQTWTERAVHAHVHDNVVISIAFTPDGKTAATGDFDGVIRLWDMQSARQIGEAILAHEWWALSLAFSPDGATLASGGTDTTIKLWDVATRAQIGETLSGHTNWITDLLFSPDGKQLISSSSDHAIRVWDVASGQLDGEPLLGHRTQVWAFQFYPPGTDQYLISVDDMGKVIRWDWQTRQPLGPPLATQVKTESMSISPDGTYLYLGTFDATIQRWVLPWEAWESAGCTIANRNLNEEELNRYLRGATYTPSCGVK